jgi:hypothetical protein
MSWTGQTTIARFLSRHNKINIYKMLIRPVLVYGSETWSLKKGDIERLRVFGRRILRVIYGPIKEGHEWRVRNNEVSHDLHKDQDTAGKAEVGRTCLCNGGTQTCEWNPR